MITFISENVSTILISALLAIIVATIVSKGIKNIKSGKNNCGCGTSCSGCAANEVCFSNESKPETEGNETGHQSLD